MPVFPYFGLLLKAKIIIGPKLKERCKNANNSSCIGVIPGTIG
jgi:hypothetical protein